MSITPDRPAIEEENNWILAQFNSITLLLCSKGIQWELNEGDAPMTYYDFPASDTSSIAVSFETYHTLTHIQTHMHRFYVFTAVQEIDGTAAKLL